MKQLKNFSSNNGSLEQELNKAKQKFGNMDEEALVRELRARIASSKADGAYSKEQMAGYISKLSPYLNQDQKAKLDKLFEELY